VNAFHALDSTAASNTLSYGGDIAKAEQRPLHATIETVKVTFIA
jgi:hypothetical protein